MGSVVGLDDPRSEDDRVSGAKASRLARARRLGLPVLPGFVVPAEHARAALAEGARVVAAGGPARARLAVSRFGLPEQLLAELSAAGRGLGAEALIVRSSAVEEGQGAWAGAFASVLDVPPDELPSALRACWASAFTPHVLERCQLNGARVEELSLGVLVQSQVHPHAGGIAVRLPDGSVSVVATAGSPAALLSGLGTGTRARVAADGAVRGEGGVLEEETARRVAGLVREVEGATGDAHIEWAAVGDDLVLLQVQPAAFREDVAGPPPAPPALKSDTALRVARLVRTFGGPAGEALVLPWALATRDLPEIRAREEEPRWALGRVRSRGAELAAAAWDLPAGDAAARAATTMDELRGPDPEEALAQVEALRPVPEDAAREVLSLLAGIGTRLVKAGAMREIRDLWRLRPERLEDLVGGGKTAGPADRAGNDRWAPFLFAVAALHGSAHAGVPASPGASAGELWSASATSDLRAFPSGGILVATHPVSDLAPLLWRAAGLVTWSGSPAAHLLHVAQSLGVPAVVGCPIESDGRAIAAVDGDAGMVWVASLS